GATEAEALEDALDTLVPVRPGRRREAVDPAREDVEKALAVELRQEAERLKRRLADRPGEALAPAGELVRIARWADVDPGHFQRSVKVTLDELEAIVRPRIEAFVARAKGLLERLGASGPATAVSTVASGVEVAVDASALQKRPRRDPLGLATAPDEAPVRPTVLLCGNGSRLPCVRKAVREILAIGPDELAWSPERAKP